ATAQDLAGNTSVASSALSVTVDTAAPAAPAVTAITDDTNTASDGVTSDNQLVISGTAEANSSVEVFVDAASIGTINADGSGNWSYDHTGITLADGSYSITAVATDTSGNASAASSAFSLVVDTAAPTVSSYSPLNGATDVAFNSNLSITFANTVYVASGSLVIRRYLDDAIVETIDITSGQITGSGSSSLTINPSSNLIGGRQYYVEVDAGALIDLAGNSYAGISGNSTWSFTSSDTAVISSTPADDATGVALNTDLTFVFNEAVTANVGNIVIMQVSDDAVFETIDVAVATIIGDGTTSITVSLSDTLVPNTAYYVEIDAGAFVNADSVAYSGISGNSTLNFTTVNVSIPTVANVTSSLADGSYRGGDTVPIQVVFSEAVDVTGIPRIYIELDGADKYISYTSGTGSTTLQFDYAIVTGDSTSDLGYVSTASLTLNGGSIRSANLANASLTLATPGAANSLRSNKDIVITAAALDITNLIPSDGFFIEGAESSSVYFGHSVSSGGDFNNDGYEDLAIGIPDSNLSNTSGGYAYLVLGQSGATRGDVSMSAFSASDGIYITGAAGADRLGSMVDVSGDLNGDGYSDLVVISSQADAAATNSGTAYVIWGSGSPANIDISTFNTSDGFTNTDGFVIAGYEGSEELGYFASTFPRNAQYLDASGDFNGDGINDLLIGHDRSDYSGTNSGVGYLIFGQTGSTRANVRLDTLTNGFQFITSGESDNEVGHSVQFIGDFNGDGNNDVLIGAPQADGGATDSGEAFVVFGNDGPTFNDIDLTALSGTDGFTITTSNSNAQLGGSVSSADINGDGLTDIIIGAPETETLSRTNNGVAIILYGRVAGTYNDVALESIPAGEGFVIHGENSTDRTSHSVRGIGDVNGDGIGDLMLSTIHDDEGGASAGAAWVIFGVAGTSRSDIDLSTLSSIDGFKIIGDASGDDFGGSATVGDINGDGYQDLMISSVSGDNAGSLNGEVNVIWGKDFSASVTAGLLGTAGADNLVGTDANDTLFGNGGADAVSAGAGNDVIQVADLNFARIDGGRGEDTLELAATSLSLDLRTVYFEVISGIEVIDLGDNGNGLSLDKLSLLGLSDQVRVLYVNGGASDWVFTDAGETWTANGTTVVNTITYNRYDNGEASLYVQNTLSQPATPSAPTVAAFSDDTGVLADDITSDTGLVFSGTSGAYFDIEVFIDAGSIGTTTADASGNWSFDHSATTLSEGNYAITAQATNLGGYVSVVSSALNVSIDTTAPSVPVVSAITTDTNVATDEVTSDTTLEFSGTADANVTIEVFIDAVSIGSTSSDGAGNWSFDHTGTSLAAATYSVTATASDVAGNTSAASSTLNVTVDTAAPAAPAVTAISNDTGSADGITSDTTLAISGTSEADALVTVLVGGGSVGTTSANGSGAWSFDYTGTALSEGSYAINATATDLAGNTSAASSTFNVAIDTSVPNTPVVSGITSDTNNSSDGVTSDTTLVIYGTSDASANIAVYLDAGLIGSATADGSGDWTFDYTGTSLSDASYNITAVASDTAANTSAVSSVFSLTIDSSAPAAPAVTAITSDTGNNSDGVTSDDTLVFSGTAEASATITVFVDAVSVGTATSNGGGAWSYDYSSTSLGDGSYSITATATDLAGNASALSSVYTVIIDTSTPAAPAITGISTDSGASDGVTNDNTLTITGTGEAGLVVDLMLDGSTIVSPTVNGGGVWSADYTGTTLGDGSYTLTATQSDTAGNVSSVSTGFALEVDTANPTLDTVSPTDGNTTVGFNNSLVLNFDDTVYIQSGNIVIKYTSDDSTFESVPVGDARVTGSGSDSITVNPSGTFSGGTGYYVEIDAGTFDDLAGNSYAGISNNTDWNFVTQATAITSSTPADDATNVALDASITLSFNEAVFANTGNIVIRKVSDGSAWDTIAVGSGQVAGSGSSTITITQTDVLEPNTAYYLTVDAGAFVNANSVSFAGVSANTELNFTTVNASIPTVTSVTSSTANGSYSVGSSINVSVVFSEAVDVTLATPQIDLDMKGIDRSVGLTSGTGTNTLQFNYTVVLGDGADDLDYTTVSALALNGARIRSAQFVNADLTLPSPGASGSLGANKDIVLIADEIDVSTMTTADGFQVQGSTAGEHLGWAVSGVGDVNGDGFEDFVTGAPDNNGAAGVAYIIYGAAGATRSNLNTSSIANGSNGFKIIGQSAVDKLGGAVASAGDINDDGYDDILVVAPLDDNYASDGGIAYIIFGAASNSDVSISSFGSSNGFRISISEASARIADSFTDFNGNGQGVDSGGDFNGDGVDDLIIGIRYSDENGADSGKAYLIFGSSGATRADVDLDLIDTTGPDGMLIYGASAGWQLGQSARFVGDYDADGYDDIVVSAIFSDALASNAGQSFLIFGSPGPIFNAIDVSTLSGGSGFKVSSTEVWSIIGHSVDGGDFNGDGISDLLISSNGKGINGKSGNGAAFVIYGNDGGSYSNIDVDTLLSSEGFAIYGENASDNMSHSLSSGGDFNADGIDDMLLGAYVNAEGGSNAGAGYMVMGKDGSSRSDVDLATLTNNDGIKVYGDAADDRLAQATGYGDVNGDGYSDLIMGATLGDNASANGGETVVIWGRDFSQSVISGLVGDAGANNIVGTSGNDTIVSGGGADAVSAGAGDDIIQLSDTSFYNIEGGLGTDTLQFSTTLNNLDLTGFGPEIINGIEVIDLADSSNTLTLSQKSVLSLSREGRTLFVTGGSSDAVVSSSGDGWCYTGTQNVGGIDYDIYLDEGAQLYVQTSVDSSAVASFNSTQTYTFNTTSGGANVSGSVTDYPVMIRVSSGIVSTLQGNKADIRFTDKDQLTWLPYEIEVGASGELYVWVLVPQVDGNSSGDYIVMHYNDVQNGAVPDRQNPAKLWKDYGAVWHFDEGASGTAYDSTAYQNHAAQISGNVGDNPDKLIGYGRRFSGNEALQAPYDISFNADNKAFTVESWVREPGLSIIGLKTAREVLSRGTSGTYWEMTSNSATLIFGTPPRFVVDDGGFGSTTLNFDGGGLLFTSTQWVHQVVVVDPSVGVRIYSNGSLADTASYENTENGQPFKMGNSSADFQLDEVRYGRFAADANRIKLNYENQRSGSTFVSPQF
ncbi:MAG: hypothetical protein GY938_06355, partial [Ketobacter sp.]|nr:hypothetical protein [Ketobacter sp.]